MTEKEVQYAIEVRNAVLDVMSEHDEEKINSGEFLFGSLVGIVMAQEQLSESNTTIYNCLDILKDHIIKAKEKDSIPANI